MVRDYKNLQTEIFIKEITAKESHPDSDNITGVMGAILKAISERV